MEIPLIQFAPYHSATIHYVHGGTIIHNNLNIPQQRNTLNLTITPNQTSPKEKMEATSVLSSSSTSSFPPSHILLSSYTSKPHVGFIFNSLSKCTSAPRLLFSSSHQSNVYTNSNSSRFSLLRLSALTVEEAVEQSTDTFSVQPKIDKSGRFCSPRAARELALYVLFLSPIV